MGVNLLFIKVRRVKGNRDGSGPAHPGKVPSRRRPLGPVVPLETDVHMRALR